MNAKQTLEKVQSELKRQTRQILTEVEVKSGTLRDRYDTLNVKTITAALAEMNTYDLTKVADYEKAHKNRKTVLREVERRLA